MERRGNKEGQEKRVGTGSKERNYGREGNDGRQRKRGKGREFDPHLYIPSAVPDQLITAY